MQSNRDLEPALNTLAENVTLYFIRHGETDWNRVGRLQGQMDIPLNDTGRKQAARNGAMLRQILPDLDEFPFVASPLARTTETMEILRAAAGLPKSGYATDPRLREVHYGNWEGALLKEVKVNDPDGYAKRRKDKFHWRPDGGESYADLSARVADWLSEIDGDTIVVSHGGVSRVLRGLLLSLATGDIATQHVPQDKIMILRRGDLEWA